MHNISENEKRTIENVPIDRIDPYEDYPFDIDEKEIIRLAISIKNNGMLSPGIVRRKGERYELLSGHRRLKACEICKMETFACEILDISDWEAANYVVESNRQRSFLKPSEKCRWYRLMIDQFKYGEDYLENVECFGIVSDDTEKEIEHLLHLEYLIPDLLTKVDAGEIGKITAYELSFISPDLQKAIIEVMEFEDATPTHAQAKRLRKKYEAEELNLDVIREIVAELKPNQKEQFTINKERIRNLVPEGKGRRATTEYILEALRLYKVFNEQGNRYE